MTADILKSYARTIRDKLRANPATPETGLAPTFQQLIEKLLPTLPAIEEFTVSPEYTRAGWGVPTSHL